MRYFDYASTAPLEPSIREKYTGYLERYYANSESHHPLGREVHKLLENSRRKTAALLGVKEKEILFTGGAAEANSLAIKGYAFRNSSKGKHIITTAIEHSSVLNSCRQLEEYFGFSVTYLGVNEKGEVDPKELEKAIRPDTILVSVMAVNNETGTIEPIDQIRQVLASHPTVKLHVDAVQALGKIGLDLKGIDMAVFAAHKIGGLKGCGVLYKKDNVFLLPLISGGDQEQGLRGGTENALNYAVFGDTLELALKNLEEHRSKVSEINRYLREKLSAIKGVVINSPEDASPYILNFSCLKLPSEVHMNALSAQGYCVSSHSTCNTNDSEFSYVLTAMGVKGERQRGIIRLSLSPQISIEDCDALIQAVKENLETYAIR